VQKVIAAPKQRKHSVVGAQRYPEVTEGTLRPKSASSTVQEIKPLNL
jgi:hypothetical protein